MMFIKAGKVLLPKFTHTRVGRVQPLQEFIPSGPNFNSHLDLMPNIFWLPPFNLPLFYPLFCDLER